MTLNKQVITELEEFHFNYDDMDVEKVAEVIIKKVAREIKEIVSSEEEMIGDMPDGLWREMGTKEGAMRVLRATVKTTKINIIRNIRQKYGEDNGKS